MSTLLMFLEIIVFGTIALGILGWLFEATCEEVDYWLSLRKADKERNRRA